LIAHRALWLVFFLFFSGHAVFLYFLIRRHLSPLAGRVVIGLTVVEAALAGLNILTWGALHPFWTWFFDLNNELALGTMITSTQYVAVGATAALIAFFAPMSSGWQRVYWLFLAAFFTFFGLDEYFVIHEPIGQPLWLYIYAAVGVLVVGLSLLAYRWFGFRENKRLFAMLLGGLAVMAFAGLGMDVLNLTIACRPEALGVECERLWVLEEYLEMAGVTLILAGFIAYAENAVKMRRIVTGAAAACGLWFLALIGNLWLLPGLEARLGAMPVQVDYLDSELALVGYRRSPETASPGDALHLTLYWRAGRFLEPDYSVSAHLLTQPDNGSIAQSDVPLQADYVRAAMPTTAWLPGATIREELWLPIPEGLITPQSLRVMVRLWHLDRDTPITGTDRPMIGDDTVVLFDLPVLGNVAIPEPPTRADYRFQGDFALDGYALPQTGSPGEALTVRFWWRTGASVAVDLQQYVHLFDSDGAFVATYDRPPFGGRFPTYDWPGGTAFVDEWEIPLPGDLPPGEYQICTGLYDPQSLVRQPVVDGEGQPIADNTICLGTILVSQ